MFDLDYGIYFYVILLYSIVGGFCIGVGIVLKYI